MHTAIASDADFTKPDLGQGLGIAGFIGFGAALPVSILRSMFSKTF